MNDGPRTTLPAPLYAADPTRAERTHVMDIAAMLREAEEALRQAMRDRTWEPTPIGQQVKSYLRDKPVVGEQIDAAIIYLRRANELYEKGES